MESIGVRELRDHGGEVLDRVARGETLVVTRDGTAVGELRPVPRQGLSAAELIARRRHLPQVDPDALRCDLDSVLKADL
jgi:prevent-host-death family protein